jgi:release factor glutamine methyltransferase
MALREFSYQLMHPLLGTVARNRWVIHRLFGVRVPKHITVHFDPTTLLLRHALLQTLTPHDRTALEVGIGQGALLALGIQKSTGIEVQGVDCSESRVHSSRQVAAHNDLESRFYTSVFFDGVPADERFDLIFFNPPYVPTGQGRRLKLTRRMRADSDRVWDGGDDGSQVLRVFLERAHSFLRPRGRIVFGVQLVFLPLPRIEEIVDRANWVVVERIRRRWLPCVAYVVAHRNGKHDESE